MFELKNITHPWYRTSRDYSCVECILLGAFIALAAFPIGLFLVRFMYASEIAPLRTRAQVTAMSSSANWISTFCSPRWRQWPSPKHFLEVLYSVHLHKLFDCTTGVLVPAGDQGQELRRHWCVFYKLDECLATGEIGENDAGKHRRRVDGEWQGEERKSRGGSVESHLRLLDSKKNATLIHEQWQRQFLFIELRF